MVWVTRGPHSGDSGHWTVLSSITCVHMCVCVCVCVREQVGGPQSILLSFEVIEKWILSGLYLWPMPYSQCELQQLKNTCTLQKVK